MAATVGMRIAFMGFLFQLMWTWVNLHHGSCVQIRIMIYSRSKVRPGQELIPSQAVWKLYSQGLSGLPRVLRNV